jgi:hypothetical protein
LGTDEFGTTTTAKTWTQSKGYDWNEMKLKEKPMSTATTTNFNGCSGSINSTTCARTN